MLGRERCRARAGGERESAATSSYPHKGKRGEDLKRTLGQGEKLATLL